MINGSKGILGGAVDGTESGMIANPAEGTGAVRGAGMMIYPAKAHPE